MTPLLKEGNKIYFFTKNLKINKRRNKKLDHIKVESFFIKVIKGRVNYELNFLVDAKIFLVFHIFMLKSTHSNTSIQKIFRYRSQENQEYEVEQILQKQSQQYLIKWKRYFTSKNTWESLKNLESCQRLLQEFQQREDWTKLSKREKKTQKKKKNIINKVEGWFVNDFRCFDFQNVLRFVIIKIFKATTSMFSLFFLTSKS